MKKQSGFTLIELMIVVAIVAILAAIAMPAYQTYVKKANFSEVVAATGPAKTAIEVCVATNQGDNGCATQATNATSGAFSTAKVASVTATGTGPYTITATGSGAAGTDTYILTGTIDATTSSRLTWAASGTCKTNGTC